jgi:cell division protease FtsH
MILVLIAVAIAFFSYSTSPSNYGTTIPYSFFFEHLKGGKVKSVTVHGELLTGDWDKIPEEKPPGLTGTLAAKFNTVLPPMLMHNQQLNNELTRQGVLYNNVPTSVSTGTEMLLWILMPVGLILIMWNMMRRSSDPFSSGGMMGGFVRSQARRFEKSENSATFNEVAGLSCGELIADSSHGEPA